MEEGAEIDMLQDLFAKMGATDSQSLVMAKQLSKRATQMCSERGVSRVDAMGYLIGLVSKGRAGESADSFLGEDETKVSDE